MSAATSHDDVLHRPESARLRRALMALVGLLLCAFTYSLGYQVGWHDRGLGGGALRVIEMAGDDGGDGWSEAPGDDLAQRPAAPGIR